MARYVFILILFLIFVVRYPGVSKQTTPEIASNPLAGVRLSMQKNLRSWLPGDTGPLASGILLGGNDGLSYKAKLAFRRSGLMHVTAASGYNVVVVAGWAMAVGKQIFGRRKAIVFGLISIGLYTYLAGLSAAVIRAGVMAGLTLTADAFGRKSEAGWLLMIAALLMIDVNPVLITDIGFQLSVAATAGLIYLTGSSVTAIVSDLKTTIAAQAATTPLILHYFGNLSVVAPLTNILVLWTVPLVMQITALASVVGWVSEPGGGLIALLAWPLLAFMDGVVKWSAFWPGASLDVGKMSWVWVGVYYLALGLLFIRRKSSEAVV